MRRKQFVLAAVVFITIVGLFQLPQVYATTDTVGAGSDAVTQADYAGYIYVVTLTPSANGVLSTIGFFSGTGSTGTIRLAIYSTLTGTPTATGLLGQSGVTTLVDGWQDVLITPTTSAINIAVGVSVYICFQVSANGNVGYNSGAFNYVAFSYGSFPTTTGTLSSNTWTPRMRITYAPPAPTIRPWGGWYGPVRIGGVMLQSQTVADSIVQPQLSATPSTISSRGTIVLSGTGFTPNGNVTILYDIRSEPLMLSQTARGRMFSRTGMGLVCSGS